MQQTNHHWAKLEIPVSLAQWRFNSYESIFFQFPLINLRPSISTANLEWATLERVTRKRAGLRADNSPQYDYALVGLMVCQGVAFS